MTSLRLLFLAVFTLQGLFSSAFAGQASPTPVLMYHGMGDTSGGSISQIKTFLEEEVPGIYVTSIRMGNNTEEDFLSSYFMNLNEQVSIACRTIASDPKLKNGYNALGFSQGGQIVRAIAQRCPTPPMLNLISIGGQHQGVYGLPRCFGDDSSICDLVRRMLNHGAYISYVQANLVQAEYWHDPIQLDLYREKSVFLADINNDRKTRNETYKANLLKLSNMVLVKFLNETIVEPKESEWFEFYADGQTDKIVSLKDSPLYKEDWIGLKQLDEAGKLKRIAVEGDHLQFTLSWFKENIVNVYLK